MRITVDRPLLKSLLVLAAVIEARDPFTGGHIWRTSRYARRIAEGVGLDDGGVFLAELGGLVHDLGKVAIPDAVLTKQGRINDHEFAVVKMHPEVGLTLIMNHPLGPLVEKPVAEHHLRIDGRGYPERFNDREPSVIGRIVSIADAFDAITSRRPYSDANSLEEALLELERGGDRQFDSRFVGTFADIVRRGELEHVLGHASDNQMMLCCPDCGPIVAPPRGAADGDSVSCPACTGEFVMHISTDTFELEWKAAPTGLHVPAIDLELAEQAAAKAPPVVEIDPEG